MKAGLDDVEGETSITGALLRHLEMRMMNKKNLAEVRWRELIWNISVMLTLHLLLTGTIAVVMLRTIPHLFVYFQANLGLYILLVFLQFVVFFPLYYYRQKHQINLVLLGLASVVISFTTIGIICVFTSGTPVVVVEPRSFCGDSNSSFCDAATDAALRAQFQAMGISDGDASCAAVIKPIICSRCSSSSGDLFDASTSATINPLMCNSINAGDSYCELVWRACKDTEMMDPRRLQPHYVHPQEGNMSASEPPLSPSTTTTMSKLIDFWRSQADFCKSFGGGNRSSPCFNGDGSFSLSSQQTNTNRARSLLQRQPSSSSSLQDAICVERIYAGGYYATMAAHPDGSSRVFLLSSQDGRIWLATIPKHGSLQGIIDPRKAARTPFLDLSDRVRHHGAGGLLGLRGIAFHPEFTTNGRFFVSYTCDRALSSACGEDSCATAGIGSQWCRYQLVVAEFSVKDGGAVSSKGMTKTDPKEVRKIFTMGFPQPQNADLYAFNHGGQIIFSPGNSKDGYLYVFTGHGIIQTATGQVDFSWNEDSDLGKIIRLDTKPFTGKTTAGETADSWGNKSNHSTSSEKQQPEIIAMGIGNPRGCSFDLDKPSYLYCSIVVNRNEMKEEYEVLLIDIEGGNHIVVVRHSGHLPVRRLPSSITGGFLYRGLTNPSLEGRYLYMYGSSVWAATETPEGSGRYASASIPMAGCSTSSPMACGSGNGAHGTIAGRVMSFGEDNNRDAFLFSTGGIYRVVRPALCHRPSTAGDEMNLLLTQPSTLTPMQAGGLLFVAGFVYVIRKLIPCSGTNGSDGEVETSTTNCNCTYHFICCHGIQCCVPMP